MRVIASTTLTPVEDWAPQKYGDLWAEGPQKIPQPPLAGCKRGRVRTRKERSARTQLVYSNVRVQPQQHATCGCLWVFVDLTDCCETATTERSYDRHGLYTEE